MRKVKNTIKSIWTLIVSLRFFIYTLLFFPVSVYLVIHYGVLGFFSGFLFYIFIFQMMILDGFLQLLRLNTNFANLFCDFVNDYVEDKKKRNKVLLKIYEKIKS